MGVLAAVLALGTELATKVLGVGSDGSGNYGYYSVTPFGSISPSATYTDRGGTARTITAIQWDRTASGAVILRLNGTGITNSDTTFKSLLFNGATFARSAATYSSNDGAGATRWLWSANTASYPSSGTYVAVLT